MSEQERREPDANRNPLRSKSTMPANPQTPPGELLACPWCGTTEHLHVQSVGVMTGDMPDRPYRVVCTHIDHDTITGPVAYGKQGARMAWNTRLAHAKEQAAGAAPDVSGLRGADKLARLMAWHHFGLAWHHASNESQEEILTACQQAIDWINRPLAERKALAANPVPGDAGGALRAKADEYLQYADQMHAKLFWPSGATRDDAKPYGIARNLVIAVRVLAKMLAVHAAPAPSDGACLERNEMGKTGAEWDAAMREPYPASPEAGVPAGMVPETFADAAKRIVSEFRQTGWPAKEQEIARYLSRHFTPKQATPTDEAVLGEREACAQVADAANDGLTTTHIKIAAAIRARSAPGCGVGGGK